MRNFRALALIWMLAAAAHSSPIAAKSFSCAHGTVLSDGTPNGAPGWDGGWDAVSRPVSTLLPAAFQWLGNRSSLSG